MHYFYIASELSYEHVTCGSILKLLNAQYDARLHSHEVSYASGSGQQSVTAVDSSDDHNSYWQVRAIMKWKANDNDDDNK